MTLKSILVRAILWFQILSIVYSTSLLYLYDSKFYTNDIGKCALAWYLALCIFLLFQWFQSRQSTAKDAKCCRCFSLSGDCRKGFCLALTILTISFALSLAVMLSTFPALILMSSCLTLLASLDLLNKLDRLQNTMKNGPVASI